MARLNINLPDELKSKLEARAAGSGQLSVEQYVETLIRADAESPECDAPERQTFHDEQELEALLLAGLAGGAPREMTSVEWEDRRRKLAERHTPREAR